MILSNLFTEQHWRNGHRGQTYGHGARPGEGEMYEKSNMETYDTIWKIDSKREFAVWLRNSNRGSVSTQWGGIGERWEGGSKERGYMYTYG